MSAHLDSAGRLQRASIWLLGAIAIALCVVAFPLLAGKLQLPDWARFPTTLVPLIVLIPIILAYSIHWFGAQASLATPVLSCLLVTTQMNGIGFGPLDLFDMVLLGAFCVWATRAASLDAYAVRFSFLFFAASALVLLCIAHLPVISPGPWFIGLFGIVRVTLLALIVVDLCRTETQLRRVSTVLIWVAAASGTIGIVQFLLAYFEIFVFNFITPLESAFKPTPFGFVMRSSGLNSTAQHFSSYMTYALPFALWHYTTTWRMRDLFLVALILGGLIVSINFGGYFASCLVMAVFPFLRWPNLRLHFALIGALCLALAYFSGVIGIAYDLSFGDAGVAKGLDQRRTLFSLGLAEIERTPWIGTGLSGFGSVDGNFWGRPVHNLFGQAAAELGIIAALIFVVIFVVLTFGLVLQLRSSDVPSRHPATMLMVLLSALLLAQSEPNLEHSNLWIMLALAQSVIMVWRSGTQRSDNKVGEGE